MKLEFQLTMSPCLQNFFLVWMIIYPTCVKLWIWFFPTGGRYLCFAHLSVLCMTELCLWFPTTYFLVWKPQCWQSQVKVWCGFLVSLLPQMISALNTYTDHCHLTWVFFCLALQRPSLSGNLPLECSFTTLLLKLLFFSSRQSPAGTKMSMEMRNEDWKLGSNICWDKLSDPENPKGPCLQHKTF